VKANEIIFRQNRVVYTLMILLAGAGLVWSFWQHQHNAGPVGPATAASAAAADAAAHTAAHTAVLSR
jgi:lipopolysaccharide export system protein LptC